MDGDAVSETSRVSQSVLVKLHYRPLRFCAAASAAVIHLPFALMGIRLFRRLEEVLVMGMRMTEGISHEVSDSPKATVTFRKSGVRREGKAFVFIFCSTGRCLARRWDCVTSLAHPSTCETSLRAGDSSSIAGDSP